MMNLGNSKNARIVFEPKTFVEIMLAAMVCEVEVSGLAKIEKRDSIYVIHGEPIVFDQTCSLVKTTFDETAYLLWQEKMVLAGQENIIQEARLWWHSHVWSGVGLSDEDLSTMRLIGQDYDWWLAMVVNKRCQVYMELWRYRPEPLLRTLIREFEFTEKLSPSMLERLLKDNEERMSEIIKQKVKIVKPVKTSGNDDDD